MKATPVALRNVYQKARKKKVSITEAPRPSVLHPNHNVDDVCEGKKNGSQK